MGKMFKDLRQLVLDAVYFDQHMGAPHTLHCLFTDQFNPEDNVTFTDDILCQCQLLPQYFALYNYITMLVC